MTGPRIAQLDVLAATPDELDALMTAVTAADTGSGSGDWTPGGHGAGDVWWLIAEQSDGYTVARHDGGRWRTARAVSDRVVPFDPARLAELRLFRPGAELLVRPSDGGMLGAWRNLDDTPVAAPLEHRRSAAVQLTRAGGQAIRHDGFTTLRRPDGTCAVVPFDGERPALALREHFTADPETGAVRVAVTCLDHYAPSVHRETAAHA